MFDANKMSIMLADGGMEAKAAHIFGRKLAEDLASFDTDKETASWALSRGFFPGRVELYGLDDSNYRNYMPDYAYAMMHPYNGWQRIWVDDKLTLKYVLGADSTSDLLPRYYLYVQNDGRYSYLMDAPEDIRRDKNFLRSMLEREGILAMKPNNGSGGVGFMKIELSGNGIVVNNELKDTLFLDRLKTNIGNYVVTSYARQHHGLAAVWSGSECTLRIIMAKIPSRDLYEECEWRCLYSYARFGMSSSGGASNLDAGGIGVGFDFETGRLMRLGYRYAKFCEKGKYSYDRHPDTGVVWEGLLLPNWSQITSAIRRICKVLGSLDYLGFDVIITEDGMQLLEINTKPTCVIAQVMCVPLLTKADARLFFEQKGLLKYLDASAFRDAFFACNG